jgi:hypothetical protein
MITTLLLAVLFGTAATVVLIIYLIDRINILESKALVSRDTSEKSEPKADNGFLGFEGKALWDVMSGKLPEGFNAEDLVALKPRFEQVLQKHIEQTFAKGASDCREGVPAKNPKPTALIKMLRGEIQSWLPPQHVSTIYKVGYDTVNAEAENLEHLRASLDESAETLYTRTDLQIKSSFSERLITSDSADAESDAIDENAVDDASQDS